MNIRESQEFEIVLESIGRKLVGRRCKVKSRGSVESTALHV